MGMMFLTRYAAVIGDREACFAEAARQILTFADRCRKGDTYPKRINAKEALGSALWASTIVERPS